jgi:hypothetical protein
VSRSDAPTGDCDPESATVMSQLNWVERRLFSGAIERNLRYPNSRYYRLKQLHGTNDAVRALLSYLWWGPSFILLTPGVIGLALSSDRGVVFTVSLVLCGAACPCMALGVMRAIGSAKLDRDCSQGK